MPHINATGLAENMPHLAALQASARADGVRGAEEKKDGCDEEKEGADGEAKTADADDLPALMPSTGTTSLQLKQCVIACKTCKSSRHGCLLQHTHALLSASPQEEHALHRHVRMQRQSSVRVRRVCAFHSWLIKFP